MLQHLCSVGELLHVCSESFCPYLPWQCLNLRPLPDEAVLGTLAVAGEVPRALTAVFRQALPLVQAKLPLSAG